MSTVTRAEEEAVSVKQRVVGRLDALRQRYPLLDHLIRTQQHYSAVNGSMQAGGVTYFGFLSFFPLLALAFTAVGVVARVYPDARADLTTALEEMLPGLVGGSDGLALSDFETNAAAVGLIGLVGLLYTGLSWLSALRSALLVVFELPSDEQPNLIIGKLRDLASLLVIGVVLLSSVSVAGVVRGFSGDLVDWVGLSAAGSYVVAAVSLLVGLTVSLALFLVLFWLLARPPTPNRALLSGAVLGGVGFEVLKWASTFLIAATRSQPAFQAFGIALVLLVWIYTFTRVVLYAAAWAHTASSARLARGEADAAAPAESDRDASAPAPRTAEAPDTDGAALSARVLEARRDPEAVISAAAQERRPDLEAPGRRVDPRLAFGAGAAAALAAVAVARRRR